MVLGADDVHAHALLDIHLAQQDLGGRAGADDDVLALLFVVGLMVLVNWAVKVA